MVRAFKTVVPHETFTFAVPGWFELLSDCSRWNISWLRQVRWLAFKTIVPRGTSTFYTA
ncbi:MAG: hypothetical protein LBI95_03845 [Holosporales bacterium]|nr:hypothetical protein [Holosporales bacterium]